MKDEQQLRRSCDMIDRLFAYGPPELCGWRVEKLHGGKGVFLIQTTNRFFARKLSKRHDTRRVEMTGVNHFRQTFEMCGSWRKIKRIIDRYILTAGDHTSAGNRPATKSTSEPRGKITGYSKTAIVPAPDLIIATSPLCIHIREQSSQISLGRKDV
jgi:hypothetical protein